MKEKIWDPEKEWQLEQEPVDGAAAGCSGKDSLAMGHFKHIDAEAHDAMVEVKAKGHCCS